MADAAKVPHISRLVLWFFRGIVRGYFRRHFTAVRIARQAHGDAFAAPRLIIYANHSSWWDPMVLVLLAHKFMPQRRHYAPIDASALERYGIFKHLGMFGVEMKTARGAANFLRTGQAILEQQGVLWITPQGRFADTRERPLDFKPGMAALAARARGGCIVLPLAIEYVFWNERLPEALMHFGEPVEVNGQTTEELQLELEAALLQTMEALKAEAMRRDPAGFRLLHHGTVGTGGFYEIGQRLKALLRRKHFQPEHSASSVPPAIPPHEERG
jgi:1-acyl-sn-glycerol-3-phosphate acyltransferase